ncbi:MAG: Asp23/Gls24 family envelope stress response protein [Firmicutes bacterium]|nr:Asp23/Gls24 family envelope stress response protein [Bacillota bacterium]
MATRTQNLYGKIVVTNRAIRSVANATLHESYGVAHGRVSEILVDENKIYLSLKLYLKYGVTPEAVCDSVRGAVKYNIENFLGMSVPVVNIKVVGIK